MTELTWLGCLLGGIILGVIVTSCFFYAIIEELLDD